MFSKHPDQFQQPMMHSNPRDVRADPISRQSQMDRSIQHSRGWVGGGELRAARGSTIGLGMNREANFFYRNLMEAKLYMHPRTCISVSPLIATAIQHPQKITTPPEAHLTHSFDQPLQLFRRVYFDGLCGWFCRDIYPSSAVLSTQPCFRRWLHLPLEIQHACDLE